MTDKGHDTYQHMKECFGLQLVWMMEDGTIDPKDMEKCHKCPDFDRCHKLSMVRSLQQIKYEIRISSRGIRESLGGAHSQHPFW